MKRALIVIAFLLGAIVGYGQGPRVIVPGLTTDNVWGPAGSNVFLNPVTLSGGVSGTNVFGAGSKLVTTNLISNPATNDCVVWLAGGILGDSGSNCGGGGGANPGGANTQIQFNNAGLFGGSPNLTWVSPTLTIGSGSATGLLSLVSSSNSNAISLEAGTTTANWTLVFPTGAGTSGQFLQTNGSGVTTWATVTATAAGSNTQLQFNSGGVLAASANLSWATPALTIGNPGSATGQLVLAGATSGTTTLTTAVAAGGTWTFRNATDTVLGAATTDTLTNKTFDSGGTGNVLKLAGVTVTGVTGTGSGVLATSPIIVTPTLSGNVTVTGNETLGAAGLLLSGATSGTSNLVASAVAGGTWTFRNATDSVVGLATVDVLTNKTLDTAGTGNVFKVNGSQITAVTGSGTTMVLGTSPTFANSISIGGTSNQVDFIGNANSTLISVGNPAAPRVYTIPDSGGNNTFQLRAGAITNGHCAQFDAFANVTDAGAPCGTGGGGTPGGANTQVQFNNNAAFGGSPNLTWVSPKLSIGVSGTTGQLGLVATNGSAVTLTPGAATGAWTLTFPTSAGSSGQFLQTNGSGVTTWASVTAAPGGSTTQVQFNNAGVLAGIPVFTWNGTSLSMTQSLNGNDVLDMARATDTSPTGNFLKFTNFAGNTTLWQVDINGILQAGSIPTTRLTGAITDNGTALTFNEPLVLAGTKPLEFLSVFGALSNPTGANGAFGFGPDNFLQFFPPGGSQFFDMLPFTGTSETVGNAVIIKADGTGFDVASGPPITGPPILNANGTSVAPAYSYAGSPTRGRWLDTSGSVITTEWMDASGGTNTGFNRLQSSSPCTLAKGASILLCNGDSIRFAFASGDTTPGQDKNGNAVNSVLGLTSSNGVIGIGSVCCGVKLTGAVNLVEEAAPSGVASSSILWADSTAHRLEFNPNNTGALIAVGIGAATTGGDCAKFAANGIDLVDAGACAGTPSWNSLSNPGANLSLSMGAFTTTLTWNAATGSGDLYKLTDSTNNTGNGKLEHITTASGSTEIPWQADANGNGLKVDTSGLLQKVGTGGIATTAIAVPHGNGADVQLSDGTGTSGNAAQFDANGNVTNGPAPTNNTTIWVWCTGQVGTANATQYFLLPFSNGNNLLCNNGAGTEMPVTFAGTMKNLWVKAGSAGAVAGSGVIQVYRNGAATGITCTLGTSTICNDQTHSQAYSAGDTYSVRVTTGQASDTTANIRVGLQYQ